MDLHRSPIVGSLRAVVVGFALAAFGIAATFVTTTPALVVEPALATAPAETSVAARTIYFVLNFLGFVLAGAAYLAVTGRGWSFVDLRRPTKRDWLYVVAGIVASIVFYVVVSVLVSVLEVPTAESEVIDLVGDDQTMVLVMIVIVFFFNAPAEEFLFRNIVQKRLYAAFSRLQAVVAASAIFATIHLPMYVAYAGSLAATLASLGIIFGGAVIFGYLYARTDNLLVPIGAHAAFNAVQFGLFYLALEYDIEGVETEPAAVLEALAALPW